MNGVFRITRQRDDVTPAARDVDDLLTELDSVSPKISSSERNLKPCLFVCMIVKKSERNLQKPF
jgi:hypothetical protein